MDAGPHTLTQYRTGGRMRFIFIVDDAEHDESAGLNIKKEAKLNKCQQISLLMTYVMPFGSLHRVMNCLVMLMT